MVPRTGRDIVFARPDGAGGDGGDARVRDLRSGREDRWRAETERWLERHGIIADGLFRRRAGDRRRDTVVKREIYERHIAGHYTVRVVFDDRDQVVRLWRDELDLPCFQVAWGNFLGFTALFEVTRCTEMMQP